MAAQETLESALQQLGIASLRDWAERAGVKADTIFVARCRGSQMRNEHLEALARVAGVPSSVVDAILRGCRPKHASAQPIRRAQR